jgi:hypothetical protein
MKLTLTNGCLLIDNSAIERWRCPCEFDMSFNDRRSLVASKAGRNFGSACHEGWAVRYQLCGTGQVSARVVPCLHCKGTGLVHFLNENKEKQTKPCPVCLGRNHYPINDQIDAAIRLWFESNPEPTSDFRNFNHAVKFLAEYNKIYGQEPFTILTQPEHCKSPGKPIIEEPFMLPFCLAIRQDGIWTIFPWDEEGYQNWRNKPWPYFVPVFYTGKIDLGIKNDNGIFSFDHKTAYQFGESWEKQLMMDGGQRGYCWALGKILGTKATGYIIDGARVRRPNKKSDYDGVAPIDPTDFVRLPKWVDADDLAEWEKDTKCIIQDILTHASNEYYPRHRWQCVGKYGACDYYEVCSSQPAQRKWQLFESSLFEANEWSPLRKNQES